MTFSLLLWFLVWGGMFTDTSYFLSPEYLSNFKTFFQGTRAFFPLLAIYLVLMWVVVKRARFPYFKDPLGFLFAYGFLGAIVSLFLSVKAGISAYWAGMYLAPLMVFWIILEGDDKFKHLKSIIQINYLVFFGLTLSLLPAAFRIGRGAARFTQFYEIPFGLGAVNRNGVGRYALIVIIVSVVRLLSEKRIIRWLYLLPIPPSLFLLGQTESRTAMLGLALVLVFFVLLKGLNLKFMLIGLAAIFVLYVSGFQGRAESNFSRLIDLSGREMGWASGIEKIEDSPFLGWGFNADRIMLGSIHMHNSYLQAGIQEGIIGVALFLAAIAAIWISMLKNNVFRVARGLRGERQVLFTESVLIVVFLTSRTFFESTAAFYGVDLLLIVPAMAFISYIFRNPVLSETEGAVP